MTSRHHCRLPLYKVLYTEEICSYIQTKIKIVIHLSIAFVLIQFCSIWEKTEILTLPRLQYSVLYLWSYIKV